MAFPPSCAYETARPGTWHGHLQKGLTLEPVEQHGACPVLTWPFRTEAERGRLGFSPMALHKTTSSPNGHDVLGTSGKLQLTPGYRLTHRRQIKLPGIGPAPHGSARLPRCRTPWSCLKQYELPRRNIEAQNRTS